MDLESATARLVAHYAPQSTIRPLSWSRGETRVIEVGAGKPLLLIHGGLGDAFAWLPIVGQLAHRHAIFAVDLPGHGLSDAFDFRGADLLELMTGFLQEVTAGLNLDRVDIVGSSLGGLFSVVYALHHPERVGRLVLVGMPGGYKQGVPLPLRLLGLPVIGRPLGRLVMSKPSRDGNRKFWGQVLVAHPERVDDSVLDADVASQIRNKESQLSFLAAALGARGLRPSMLLGSRWERIEFPTLLAWGERDVYGDPSEGDRLVARNPRLRLVRIPDAGHLPWFDAPDRVVEEIEAFLQAEGS